MEIRVLRYFWTVAEEGSISRAAELLHITQPTLSRQIKGLEEEVGTNLFTRDKNHLFLTEAGFYLKDRAQEILALVNHTQQEFIDQKKYLFSGTITIGCVEAKISRLLASLIKKFASAYPQVKFSIFSGTGEEICERLDKGLLDIGIVLEPIHIEKYEGILLNETEIWGLLVNQNSPLAGKKAIRPEDLKVAQLFCSSRQEVKQMLAKWMGSYYDELHIIGHYNLIFTMYSLVEAEVGEALIIDGVVRNQMNSKCSFIPLEPKVETKCQIICKKNRIFSPVVTQFIKELKYASKA